MINIFMAMQTGRPGFEPRTSNIEEPFIKTEERAPRTPHIINYNLHNANSWYEINFPKNVISWQLKTRGDHEVRYSFEPSHSTYMTLPAGGILAEDTSPNMDIKAIYVMSETAEIVVEVELWLEGLNKLTKDA